MPPKRRWTMPEAKEMRRWYESGMSLREVGIQFGYEKTTAGRAIEAAGGTLRASGFTRHQYDLATETRRQNRMTEGEQMSTEQETLGQRIKRLRLAKGLTQKAVSEVLNVHSGYFSRLEGDSRPIRDHMVAAIAAVLGTTPEELTRDVREVAIPKQTEKKRPATPEPEHSQAYLDQIAREEARASVALDKGEGQTQTFYDDQGNLTLQEGPVSDQLEAEAYGGMSVLCYDDQHDRCKAPWCTCPHHQDVKEAEDTGWEGSVQQQALGLDLDQEAVEAEAVAERDQALYDMELEYTVRASIAQYLRREALSQDSRLVKAYVCLLADEIIAQRDKRSS